jgi:hypothetical protein
MICRSMFAGEHSTTRSLAAACQGVFGRWADPESDTWRWLRDNTTQSCNQFHEINYSIVDGGAWDQATSRKNGKTAEAEDRVLGLAKKKLLDKMLHLDQNEPTIVISFMKLIT